MCEIRMVSQTDYKHTPYIMLLQIPFPHSTRFLTRNKIKYKNSFEHTRNVHPAAADPQSAALLAACPAAARIRGGSPLPGRRAAFAGLGCASPQPAAAGVKQAYSRSSEEQGEMRTSLAGCKAGLQ